MSIEVHILGTSSARPTSIRQVSGNLISCHDGIVVVDAGEGFQTRFFEQRKRMKQYDKYHLKPSKVKRSTTSLMVISTIPGESSHGCNR